jgi:hypothetical protein
MNLQLLNLVNDKCPLKSGNLFIDNEKCKVDWLDKLATALEDVSTLEEGVLTKMLKDVKIGWKETLCVVTKAEKLFHLELEWRQLAATGTKTSGSGPRLYGDKKPIRCTPETLLSTVNIHIARTKTVTMRYQFSAAAIKKVQVEDGSELLWKSESKSTKVQLKALVSNSHVEVTYGMNQKTVPVVELELVARPVMRQSTLFP